jgi:hypothetical protein
MIVIIILKLAEQAGSRKENQSTKYFQHNPKNSKIMN